MENNKSVTAVDWLVEEMLATDWWYLSQSMKQDIIEQAKEMEKNQQCYSEGEVLQMYKDYEAYVIKTPISETLQFSKWFEKLKMENKFLQSVERYTNEEQGKTGYKVIYSNGLDFETLFFPIKNGVDNINIPSIVKSVMTIEEIESIGAELLTSKSN